MKYLKTNSLFQTVDNVSEALFSNLEINNNERKEIANFIVNQQGKPKTYADTFAPTEIDLQHDLILFTGEKIKTNAGKRHIIGEEASRILRLIGINNEKIQKALQKSDFGLQSCIISMKDDSRYILGTYCCKACSSSLWLNVSSGGLKNESMILESGLSYLKSNRDGKGNWKGYPANYILYV